MKIEKTVQKGKQSTVKKSGGIEETVEKKTEGTKHTKAADSGSQ